MSSKKTIKSAFESMMFVWGEPLDVATAAEVLNIEEEDALECFLELVREYEEEGRGIIVRQVENAFQLVTKRENEFYVEKLCTPVKRRKLSQSALEVLAIIAYKQPVTKGEIDAIRGIKCDRIIDGLMKKELVCERGRSNSIGKPMQYGTTDVFLRNFGFSSLDELPEIEDVDDVFSEEYGENRMQMSLQDLDSKEEGAVNENEKEQENLDE